MATTQDNTTKAAVLKLLASGEIDLFEAAKLSGESRQRIAYWARHIDIEAARAAYLARVWTKALKR